MVAHSSEEKIMRITKEDIREMQRSARRELSREQGYYDGRFAPKREMDARAEREKYLCREDVEVPVDEQKFEIKPSSHRL
jgi:hypothetical protein